MLVCCSSFLEADAAKILSQFYIIGTFQETAVNFYWSKMRVDITEYVHCCDLCQTAKLAQFTRVGLHSASPISRATERLFIDFMGTLTQSKQGNTAILVVLDEFSKFVSFSSVQKISSQVVCDSLKRVFLPSYGMPTSIVTDSAKVFRCMQIRDLCFQWGITHKTTTPYYLQGSLME
jgi:hypothetical protein